MGKTYQKEYISALERLAETQQWVIERLIEKSEMQESEPLWLTLRKNMESTGEKHHEKTAC